MYWFLFLIFRFIIRRDVGSVGLADVLIQVIVADASQNALAGNTPVSATAWCWWRHSSSGMCCWTGPATASPPFAAFRRMAEPRPLELVENGRLLRRNMRREFLSGDELWSKLRQAGIESLDEVKRMYIESDGQISVIRHRR